MPPRVAICFHGFLRTGASMWWVSRRLRRAGFLEVALPTFGYHLRPLAECADAAARAARSLCARHPGAEMHLVTHSYGGVLARATWASHEVPPLRRGVLISPPNQGAVAADLARKVLPVHHAGWDPFGPMRPGVPAHWPLPPGEIGILTGGTGTPRGYNPLFGQDNDGTIAVEEARHDGAVEFLVVPVQHSLTILAPSVLDRVERFLSTGRF